MRTGETSKGSAQLRIHMGGAKRSQEQNVIPLALWWTFKRVALVRDRPWVINSFAEKEKKNQGSGGGVGGLEGY